MMLHMKVDMIVPRQPSANQRAFCLGDRGVVLLMAQTSGRASSSALVIVVM